MTTRRRILGLCALAAVWASACGDPGPRVDVSRDGALVLSVYVRLAETAAERAQGLRGSAPLASDEGLLIVLPRELGVCVVNDGVPESIDAVFASDADRVTAVEAAIPADDPTARCHRARRILELPGGRAAPIQLGDTLSPVY